MARGPGDVEEPAKETEKEMPQRGYPAGEKDQLLKGHRCENEPLTIATQGSLVILTGALLVGCPE